MYYDGITLGISNVFHSLEKIGICHKRARFALAASLFWSIPYVNFDELGFFQILFSSSDPELLQSVYQNSLGALEDFDSAHDTDYMDTLKVFLLSDCNLLKTADKMHTHRNTIIYRMKKIKELLRTKLDDSKIKFDLLMAFISENILPYNHDRETAPLFFTDSVIIAFQIDTHILHNSVKHFNIRLRDSLADYLLKLLKNFPYFLCLRISLLCQAD